MNKQQIKIDIFKKYLINYNKIVGRVIDVDYKKQSAKFWIQDPPYLKKELAKGRHTPNIFYFHNITPGVSYSPKQGDLINANVIVSNNNLVFYNISNKKKIYKTKRVNSYIINKRFNTRRQNNRKSNSRTRQQFSKKKRIPIPTTKTPTPRVFMLLGHSYECILEHSIINPKVYEMLKKEYEHIIGYFEYVLNNSVKQSSQYLFFNEIEKTLMSTDVGMNEWILSTAIVQPDKSTEPAVYFNKTRFDNKQHGFLCGKEGPTLFGNDELLLLYGDLDKLALVEDPERIDLKNDFSDILPNNKIKFLNGQSTGRAGLISTSFNIMEFMQEMEDFRQLIYNSKNMGDMAKLDKYLNMANKYYKYHRDHKDTDFAIYPRINHNGYEVNGPKDTNISFNPSPDMNGNYINGDVWPLGIFELPVFDTSLSRFRLSSIKYNTLFKNYSGNIINGISPYPEWEFYSVIKNTSPEDIIKRALLIDIPESKSAEWKEVLDNLDSEIKTITKYNRFLVSNMKTPIGVNPNKEFKLSDLIKNTIRLADIKPREDVIFITNICRVVKFPKYSEKYMTNQLSTNRKNRTVPKNTRNRIKALRRNSRGF